MRTTAFPDHFRSRLAPGAFTFTTHSSGTGLCPAKVTPVPGLSAVPERTRTPVQPNTLLPSARRIPTLDGARTRGIHVEFYDPDGSRYGLPTYPYRWAPKNLLTVRQLRARGLRPGGQQPVAQILWRQGRRVAYLYDIRLALPKRTATPAQLAALAAAMRARRTCPACGREKPYCIPVSTGTCNDCTWPATS